MLCWERKGKGRKKERRKLCRGCQVWFWSTSCPPPGSFYKTLPFPFLPPKKNNHKIVVSMIRNDGSLACEETAGPCSAVIHDPSQPGCTSSSICSCNQGNDEQLSSASGSDRARGGRGRIASRTVFFWRDDQGMMPHPPGTLGPWVGKSDRGYKRGSLLARLAHTRTVL